MFSFKLQPDEKLAEQPQDDNNFGLKSMYTPLITDRRVAFRFNSLSSGLVQSYHYDEITQARSVSRLLVKYLKLTVKGREYFLQVEDPESLADRINELMAAFKGKAAGPAPVSGKARPTLAELIVMLENLREYGLLTDEEFEDKRSRITD